MAKVYLKSIAIRGNGKVGNIPITNLEPVATCPGAKKEDGTFRKTCLDCYAIKTMKFRKNARKKWSNASAQDEIDELANLKTNKPVRLHGAGDFIDQEHLDGVSVSMEDKRGWYYTRSFHVGVTAKGTDNMQEFASIDEDEDVAIARAKGYNRLARVVEKKEWEDGGKKKLVVLNNENYVVCPEQLKTKASCESCGFCFNKPGKVGNVAFIKH